MLCIWSCRNEYFSQLFASVGFCVVLGGALVAPATVRWLYVGGQLIDPTCLEMALDLAVDGYATLARCIGSASAPPSQALREGVVGRRRRAGEAVVGRRRRAGATPWCSAHGAAPSCCNG